MPRNELTVRDRELGGQAKPVTIIESADPDSKNSVRPPAPQGSGGSILVSNQEKSIVSSTSMPPTK